MRPRKNGLVEPYSPLQLAQQSAELTYSGYGSVIAEAGFNPIDLKAMASITRLRAFHHGTAVAVVDDCQFMSRGYGLLCANRARSR